MHWDNKFYTERYENSNQKVSNLKIILDKNYYYRQ